MQAWMGSRSALGNMASICMPRMACVPPYPTTQTQVVCNEPVDMQLTKNSSEPVALQALSSMHARDRCKRLLYEQQ